MDMNTCVDTKTYCLVPWNGAADLLVKALIPDV